MRTRRTGGYPTAHAGYRVYFSRLSPRHNQNRHGCIQLSARNRAGAGTSAPDRESVTTGSDGGGGHEGGRGTHAEQVVESPSVAVPVKRRLSVQAVAAEVADKVMRCCPGWSAFLLLFLFFGGMFHPRETDLKREVFRTNYGRCAAGDRKTRYVRGTV